MSAALLVLLLGDSVVPGSCVELAGQFVEGFGVYGVAHLEREVLLVNV